MKVMDETARERAKSDIALEIYKLAGQEFDIESPIQLREILYAKLKLPVIERIGDTPSVKKSVLEQLRDKYPIVEKYLMYRSIQPNYQGKRKLNRVDIDDINEYFINELNITPLGKQIVEIVYYLRGVWISQIVRITGATIKTVRKVTNYLYKNRILDRKFPREAKQEGETGTIEGYYMLDVGGKILIAGMNDLNESRIKWKVSDNMLKYERMYHVLECADVIAVVSEKAREKRHRVDFRGEKHLFIGYMYEGKKYEFNPDLYLKYDTERETFRYFVEVDNFTEDVNTFCEKIPKYDNFKMSGKYKNFYDAFPRVLIITTNMERAKRLKEAVAKRVNSNVEYFFSYKDQFKENPFSEVTFITLDGSYSSMFDKTDKR